MLDEYFDNLKIDDYLKEHEIQADLAVKKEIKSKSEGHLTIDVFQTENEIVIQSTIAGADSDDIDVSITKDMVTIRGKREPEHKTKPSDYFHRELYWGPFSRAVILPADVDTDNAKAEFKNGILTISLPKLETKTHRKLKLNRFE